MIRKIIDSGDLGEIRYINTQRLNLGLFQKDINVVWDLAPHDLSIILHLLDRKPVSVNCQGNAHVTPGIEDVANLSLNFLNGEFATIQSSWLEPRKVRQMTIVGTRKMVVYDDIEPMEKIRIAAEDINQLRQLVEAGHPDHATTFDQAGIAAEVLALGMIRLLSLVDRVLDGLLGGGTVIMIGMCQ